MSWYELVDPFIIFRTHLQLGELPATALCGNDITSSCLYVAGMIFMLDCCSCAGVCAYYAGFWAPICIFFVSFGVLYLYRIIYTNVVSSLPYNGGAYTVLLNTTSKPVALLAGFLTFLSYVSTAVMSAVVAVSYARHLMPWINEDFCTILVLWGFAVLNFIGLRDSANVAVAIFVLHVIVLCFLSLDCILAVFSQGAGVFYTNYALR